jgi:hypothetical protein
LSATPPPTVRKACKSVDFEVMILKNEVILDLPAKILKILIFVLPKCIEQ